ncbi:MAG TPA: HAMP domain-containing sensor histidine kinase [Rhabdaerophilum sp.]|nr:HAMP domain-containing sensor histidine kinase [Rhabdaerophilum sp.]
MMPAGDTRRREDIAPPDPATTRAWWKPGLSGRVLLLTIIFVLIAEILIYVPSVANFRNTWLGERISQAKAAAVVLEKTPPDTLPKAVVDELLAGIETTMIALRIDNMRRLLAVSDMPPMVDFEIDLRSRQPLREIASAFDTLLFGGNRTIRVVGPPPRGGDFVEIVIGEASLRAAMIRFSRNILLLSLMISAITAVLVFAALNGLIVKPVKSLANAVSRFRADPANARAIHRPSARDDEFGMLERSVSDMQSALQTELRQREHLANLGLAVAKINHDLRNMLAAAQLMADRLGSLPDSNVQRFVPKLLGTLDRAIAFCQTTLAYGKAQERAPDLVPVNLKTVLGEIADQLMLSPESDPALVLQIPTDLVFHADPDHLGRVITNLLRNARAALEKGGENGPGLIHILAADDGKTIRIEITDNGPGIPARIRQSLFKAFSGSAHAGGTGLGLAIAQELMRGMGGAITLIDPEPGAGAGTTFRLLLPKV